MKKLVPLIVSLLLAQSAIAAKPSPIVGKVPGWIVIKVNDSMSDKVNCTVHSAKYDNVFINSDSINVWMKSKGGVSAYQYRFDGEKATAMMPRMEGFDSADGWENKDMDRILASKRLLVRILPIIGQPSEYDIDLSHAKEAYEIMSGSKCM